MKSVAKPAGPESTSLAEAAPLLRVHHDPTVAVAQAERSHGTFPDTSQGSERITTGEDGYPRLKDGQASGGDGPDKPVAKMAALMPALALSIFLVGLDQTVTIATYGRIGTELEALSSTSWIATSFFLTLTTFQPLYGKLSDIFGRKACLLSACAVFGIGCLGCGLAQDIVQLCLARAVAGAGGGGMNAIVSILVTDLVSLRDRGVWQGYMNIVWAAGLSAGAPIGGLLADSIGWRWVFIVQAPLALLAFIAVYVALKLPHADNSHWTSKFLRIDFIGAFTLVSAVCLLLVGLDNGSNEGWGKQVTIVPLAVAPAVFAIFVLVEAKVAKEPFAPGRIIFDPPLLAANGASFSGVAAQMGVLFFIALFFQAALGMSASLAGFMFLPSTAFGLFGSLSGGMLIRRTGKYYWLTVTGYVVVLLGGLFMVGGVSHHSAAGAVVGLCILAAGISGSLTTTLVAVIANVEPQDMAVAVACSYLFRSLGTIIGISISTATLQQALRISLAQELGGTDRAREIEEQVRLSLDYINTLEPNVAAIVRSCYATATEWAFLPILIFAVLAIAASLFIKERKLDR
ncbi:MFS multidrug transporter [Poronia punctata]|nr:MFS multidrug transporter [Poronia punctata]